MVHAKIKDADGKVVARVTFPDADDVAMAVPPGGSWDELSQIRRVYVVLWDGEVAVKIEQRFVDELEGQTEIDGYPFSVVQHGHPTLEDFNGPDFPARRANAQDAIDQAMGEARKALLTTVPGQDYVYSAKYAEAVAVVADTDPDPANYPYLGAMDGDLVENANAVIAARAASDATLAQMEADRLRYKAAIAALPDDADLIELTMRGYIADILNLTN